MTVAKEATTLAQALVAAQAAMPRVEPDATNPHFKSRFVSLDHLIAKTRPVLNKHGLAILQAPSADMDGKPALTTTIYHVSGEKHSSQMPLLVGREDMQGLGAALTYARRYAWAAALGICADEDDDGEQASQVKPKATVSGATGTIDQLEKKLKAKAAEYAEVKDGFDPTSIDVLIAKHRGDAKWLDRNIALMEHNITEKKNEFKIPAGVGASEEIPF